MEDNMTKLLIIFALLMLFISPVGAEKVNPDKPLKGEWNLESAIVWTITGVGEDTLARPEIAVAEDDTLCIWDWKNRLSYLFDKMGKFKKVFGRRGEGPGEMRWHLNTFFTGGKLVTVDMDRLHFFTMDGEYIKSAVSMVGQQEPLFFLSEDEFIAGTVSRFTDGKGELSRVNLQTGKKTPIEEFSVIPKGKRRSGPNLTLVGLSPMVVTTYDPEKRKIYYGISTSYSIHSIDLEGKILDTFSLERKKKTVSMDEKVKELRILDPSGPVNEIAKVLPGEVVYFHRIQVENGLVLVFTGNFGTHWDNQSIDIFSSDGTYLYRTVFKPSEGEHIYSATHCILIRDHHLYVILEDDDGEVKVSKYRINLPKV
jgi:hypothetical protein